METKERKYWASRIGTQDQDFFWAELKAGRLRQGWGYNECQDLRLVTKKSWQDQSPEQKETYRQRHMLGNDGGWQEGDVILVPNVPTWGTFALAEVVGPYRFEIDKQHADYGHIRDVKLLTPQGVAKTYYRVNKGIRATLRNAGRTWSIDHLRKDIDILIAHADDRDIREQSTEIQRTERTLDRAMSAAVEALQADFGSELSKTLRAAEWEEVITRAIQTHFPMAAVEHTGGPNEHGADIEVVLENPFGGAPWIIVVQVKDYEGEIGSHVVGQLREAVESRRKMQENGESGGHVVAAVLASTNAKPSAELLSAISALQQELGVPVTTIHGNELMKLILRGVVQHGALEQDVSE